MARLKTLKQRKHTRELCVESSRPGADAEFDSTRARLFTSAEHLVASAAFGTSNVQDLQGLSGELVPDTATDTDEPEAHAVPGAGARRSV